MISNLEQFHRETAESLVIIQMIPLANNPERKPALDFEAILPTRMAEQLANSLLTRIAQLGHHHP